MATVNVVQSPGCVFGFGSNAIVVEWQTHLIQSQAP